MAAAHPEDRKPGSRAQRGRTRWGAGRQPRASSLIGRVTASAYVRRRAKSPMLVTRISTPSGRARYALKTNAEARPAWPRPGLSRSPRDRQATEVAGSRSGKGDDPRSGARDVHMPRDKCVARMSDQGRAARSESADAAISRWIPNGYGEHSSCAFQIGRSGENLLVVCAKHGGQGVVTGESASRYRAAADLKPRGGVESKTSRENLWRHYHRGGALKRTPDSPSQQPNRVTTSGARCARNIQ